MNKIGPVINFASLSNSIRRWMHPTMQERYLLHSLHCFLIDHQHWHLHNLIYDHALPVQQQPFCPEPRRTTAVVSFPTLPWKERLPLFVSTFQATVVISLCLKFGFCRTGKLRAALTVSLTGFQDFTSETRKRRPEKSIYGPCPQTIQMASKF